MTQTINTELNKLNQTSGWVELFQLYYSPTVYYYFTPNVKADHTAIVFNGLTYQSLPVEGAGFDFTSTASTAAKPTLTISNANKTLLALVISSGDMVGAKITRIRTYDKYLDGASNADPTKFIGPDIYYVEKKTAHDNKFIQWQLTSVIDRLGTFLPKRQILKDPTPDNPEGFPGVSRLRGA
jgi:lambda family phage minor tail protein L